MSKEPIDKVNDFVRMRMREEQMKAHIDRLLNPPGPPIPPPETWHLFTDESQEHIHRQILREQLKKPSDS